MALKEDFKGTGSMVELAEEINKISHALNNIRIKMPLNYKGYPATARIENGEFVIDLQNVNFN